MSAFLQFFVRLDQDLEALLVQQGPLAYASLALIIFCSVGVLPLVFLPADMLLFVAGTLAAIGVLRAEWLAPLLVLAGVAGHVFNYGLARAIASIWKPSPSGWIRASTKRTRDLYARFGAALLLFSPYLAVVRGVAPAMAGATRMPFGRFAWFAAGGVAIWVVGLAGPGYFFGNVPWVRAHWPAAMAIVIGAGGTAFVVRALWRVRRSRHAGAALREH